MKVPKPIAMDVNFNNQVGGPVMLIVTLLMTLVGMNISAGEYVMYSLDMILAFSLKLIPFGTLTIAYLSQKEKVDANFKKSLASFKNKVSSFKNKFSFKRKNKNKQDK